jgi:hypothetical protein
MAMCENEQKENAMIYVAGLLNPSIPGVRVADSSALPSEPIQLVTRLTVPLVTGSSTADVFGGVNICPNLKGMTTVITSGTTKDAVQWGSNVDHPDESSIASNYEDYRVVSLGARVLDFGDLQSRGMAMYCGTVPMWEGVNLEPSDLIAAVDQLRTVVLMDSATCANACNLTWLPYTGSGVEHVASGTAAVACAPEWRPVAYPLASLDDNFLFFYAYQNAGAATPSDSFTVEIYFNLEVTPLLTEPYLPVPTKALGSDAAVSEALSAAKLDGPVMPEVQSGWIDNITDAVSDVFGYVSKGVEFVEKAAGFADMLGGLFGMKRDALRVLVQRHRMLLSLGLGDLSPLCMPKHRTCATSRAVANNIAKLTSAQFVDCMARALAGDLGVFLPLAPTQPTAADDDKSECGTDDGMVELPPRHHHPKIVVPPGVGAVSSVVPDTARRSASATRHTP